MPWWYVACGWRMTGEVGRKFSPPTIAKTEPFSVRKCWNKTPSAFNLLTKCFHLESKSHATTVTLRSLLRDKLVRRLRTPSLHKIEEYFDHGRPFALRTHVIVNGRTKEMHFYHESMSNGLVKRVHEPFKVPPLMLLQSQRNSTPVLRLYSLSRFASI